tara:strand:- start:913 stop:1422 length:510 start_codon:yes stop_codon:yes gene_type:complete
MGNKLSLEIKSFEKLKKETRVENGKVFWTVSKRGRKLGKEIGSVFSSGYRLARINGKIYSIHRFLYYYYNNTLPEFIDHIDRNRSNNTKENLRAATIQQNNQNASIRSDNKSGTRGVSWSNFRKKWVAQISLSGKSKNLGRFEDKNDAIKARQNAEKKYFGDFAVKTGK